MVEPRLVGRLIVDVAGQPNALPLFQYALTELFDERSGPVLDLATYERVGGVRKAVARRAESIYTHLDGPEQEAVRQLFLRIATVSGEAVGRRRVPASELAALDVDIVALQGAIDSFTALPTPRPRPRPHDGRADRRGRARGAARASGIACATGSRRAATTSPRTRGSWSPCNEWETAGRDAGYLLTGARLDDYESWAATSRLQLTARRARVPRRVGRALREAEERRRARAR